MRPPVTYVLGFNYLAGGVRVVLNHASGLRSRGWDCEIFSTMPPPTWWHGADPGWRHFPDTDALGAALRSQPPGVKVGTFTPHWSWVWENLNPGDRGYGLLQDFDGETYARNRSLDEQAVKRLAVITEGEWVTLELWRRHGVRATNVGIGVEEVFRPLPMVRERLRVFAPARTSSAGRADLKGWEDAKGAVHMLAGQIPDVSLVTFGQDGVPAVWFCPHVHVQNPNDRKLRELYCQAGVVLVPSRHEGFGLVQAEAHACGAPVVCTDAEGNSEFSEDGVTCLVAPPGDAPALAGRLFEVLTDPVLADRLGAAGLERVRGYRWGPVLDRLERLYGGKP